MQKIMSDSANFFMEVLYFPSFFVLVARTFLFSCEPPRGFGQFVFESSIYRDWLDYFPIGQRSKALYTDVDTHCTVEFFMGFYLDFLFYLHGCIPKTCFFSQRQILHRSFDRASLIRFYKPDLRYEKMTTLKAKSLWKFHAIARNVFLFEFWHPFGLRKSIFESAI